MKKRQAESVAVVIPCFEQKHFLAKAIASAVQQSPPPREIIVVDDGSSEKLSDITSRTPGVRLIEQPNRGCAAARNAGLRASSSEKIIFLDADDRLMPQAISAGLKCFRKNPDAGFVYGAFMQVEGNQRSKGYTAVSSHRDLIRCNWIVMIGTVMFDRAKLLEVGGFDESLGACDDWDAYLRVSRRFPFATHRNVIAEYLKHDAGWSANVEGVKHWIEVIRAKEWDRGLDAEDRIAWHEGELVWRQAFDRSQNQSPDPDQRQLSLGKRIIRRAARHLRQLLGG